MVSGLSALHRKLLRELLRLWAQVLAIALVMAAGVATLLIGIGTYQSLERTREAYYQSHHLANVFATVTRAPGSMLAKIGAMDGVLAVDGRIVKVALADIEGLEQPASVRLISLPQQQAGTLNRLYLRSGRLPEAANHMEAVVSEIFAQAHGFREGSQFGVVVNGAWRQVTITGIALAPDHVYAIAPGEITPNSGRFGILWAPERTLAAAYDLGGAFNAVSVQLAPGTPEDAVITELDRLLDPFGAQGAHGRSQLTSHAYLDAELQQLRSMSEVLPPVFLLVAAFLVNMTLTRLIALEREQIGLLKAIGYSGRAIAWHYVEFVLLIAIIGLVIGTSFGVWAGNALTELYTRFYSFPVLVFSREPSLYAIAGGITLSAAVVGAIRAVRAAAALPPAVAMSPPAPPTYRRHSTRRLHLPLRQTGVMVMRHLLHRPWRSGGGIVGIALSVAVLVGSLWSVGGVEFMIDYSFNRTERQDAIVNFTSSKPLAATAEIARLPGVLSAEPFRAVGVEIGHAQVTRQIALMGRPATSPLTRILDADLKVVPIPPQGVLLTRSLAGILGVSPGDSVDIRLLDGERQRHQLHVAAVVESYLGLGAYMDMAALQALIGEGNRISGVNVTIDSLHQSELFAALKRSPSLGHISLQAAALTQFRATMAQNMYVMIAVLVGLASLIAFGVVYNFARISLSEQGREMASLRVLGFTRGEVSALLLTEIAILTLLAQPLGWFLGVLVARGMVEGFSSELFSMPLIIGPDVFATASLAVVAAALVSGLVVRRRVDRLDLIAVLKTRE